MPTITGNGISITPDAILSENISYSAMVTNAPIEGRGNINDHFVNNPLIVQLAGVCTTDSINKDNNFKILHENGTICRYEGRIIIDECVIVNYSPVYDISNGTGFSFNLTLQKIKISQTQMFMGITNVGVNNPASVTTDSITFQAATSRANEAASKYGIGRDSILGAG